ncbi:hypothetical protein WUBG_15164 [Wuchereria bancrofti]|uniref:STAT transcription factor all-alpha domain-containing protein n=1 Tax=Wuchereria bancrofti TaxID=6293 RepID=J9EA96_WUCBA|nr:hypothetical protein WUBG_15164 [Wuchereria bancrofti]
MLCYGEIKTTLLDLTKECHTLWEENKDMQGRFVNDLTELHRMQLAVSKLERDHRDDKLSQARISVSDMQKRASQLYNALMEKRCNLTQKLNEGVHNVALLQNELISDYLYDWKNRQKLQQVGVPFKERDRMIDEIQTEPQTVRSLFAVVMHAACAAFLCLQYGNLADRLHVKY